MTGFFTCIIFIGSGLVLFSFLLMLYEKKRLYDYRNDIRDKKEDLIQIIEDAEELITEINRFSEYTVNQIEETSQVLTKNISEADLKIEALQSSQFIKPYYEANYTRMYDNSHNTNYQFNDKRVESTHDTKQEVNFEHTQESSAYDEASVSRIIDEGKPKAENLISANKGKILTFDLKRREIIKLAKSGLNSTEIAKIINCGKGEIELIARMGR